jgi:hypothetical protein
VRITGRHCPDRGTIGGSGANRDYRMSTYDKTQRRIVTELSLSPIVGSAAVAGAFAMPDFGASGLTAARDVLREAADKVRRAVRDGVDAGSPDDMP